MMRKLIAVILGLLLLCTAALAEDAQGIMDRIGAEDYQGVYDACDAQMQAALAGPEGFAAAWSQIQSMLGAYQGVVSIDEAAGKVVCDFDFATAELAVAFDGDGKLSTFVITGYTAKTIEETGPWTEEAVTLRQGGADETGGLLTLPEGDGPFPCAIMMQGSGSSDRNETSYGFPVFGKLAHALAERGVATLRYDKYSQAHPELCAAADFSVDDEYTRDALSAYQLLENDARIDGIYLMGHSEGAMVAPRVARAIGTERVAGLALVAGSPLPLWKILIRQLNDQGYEEAAAFEAKFEGMAGMTDEELRTDTVMGAYLYYWQDQGAYDYASAITESGLPVYIAQGGKDYQVLPSEGAEAWRAALGGYEGAEYAFFENMTHLLFDKEGEITGSASDYVGMTEISPALADGLADWMLP